MATDEKVKHNEFACPQCGHDFCGLASELANALKEAVEELLALDALDQPTGPSLPLIRRAEAALKKAGL